MYNGAQSETECRTACRQRAVTNTVYFIAYGNGLDIDQSNEAHSADNILCIWFTTVPSNIYMFCPTSGGL